MSSNYCSTKQPSDWQEFRTYLSKNLAREEDGSTIYINTRYVVLWNDEEQKIPVTRIRSNHKDVNLILSGQNSWDTDKIPNSDAYPFKDLLSVPNIQLLPLDPNDISIEYIKISTNSISNTSPVTDAADIAGIVDGKLNVYIANTTSSIIGQAELESNILYVHYGAVGGREYPGVMSNYNQGKDMLHELYHVFSLPHIFGDDQCDNLKLFPDIPEQVNPNFDTELYQLPDNTWTMKNDNRYKDRLRNSFGENSCLHVLENHESHPGEMGVNVMDYGIDDVSLMVTPSQTKQMRLWLLSNQSKLSLQEGDGVTPIDSYISSETSNIIESSSDGSSGSNTAFIISMVLVGVFIIGIILYVIYINRSGSSSGSARSRIKAFTSSPLTGFSITKLR
jgi:hypothetical protein